MATTVNNNNIESKNQVIIDMRPQVKHQDGHGREVLADVHFRIDVQAYVNNFYTYTKEAREESEKACEAYYSEVVELLKAEGWTLRKEKYGVGDCPQMVKGTQYLYCHPQDISGQVNPADIEALEAKIKALTSCKFYKTDNYGDIIVTTSESDEKQLYRDTYADGLASIWQEVTTTKRSNLYKDKAEAESCVRRRICIANRRADLNDIGTGSYNMRSPLLQFLMEEYDRLLQAGYIKEAEGQNGRTLCRWINKKEEKERAKAIREAEKAEKERKAAERQERYEARCKELETEALAQMPYKVGDIVKSRDGVAGRVIEMHPELTGDTDSPHLIYEYDGKPTVNVVILDADGKRHCAHWSVYTLEPASEIKAVEHKVTPEVINAHMKALKEQDSQKRKAPAYAVGTRVLCKAYGVMGTVKENNYLYKVEYDSPVDCNGHTYTYGIYGEYGITTNYDKQGREIIGNANYYAYELTASYWGESQPRLFHLAGLDITATQHGLVWQVTALDCDGMINRYALMQTEELAAYLAELYAKEHTPDLDSTGTDNDTLQQPQEIREKLTIKFHSDRYNLDFAGVVHIDDIEINEPHSWHAHDFTLNDLNYSASIWGSLDYFEKPTTANLSVQVEMYGNGTFDIIRDIEIVECK